MFEALLIILASLGVINDTEPNDIEPMDQQEVRIGDPAPTPDSDDDEDSKHSTKEGI